MPDITTFLYPFHFFVFSQINQSLLRKIFVTRYIHPMRTAFSWVGAELNKGYFDNNDPYTFLKNADLSAKYNQQQQLIQHLAPSFIEFPYNMHINLYLLIYLAVFWIQNFLLTLCNTSIWLHIHFINIKNNFVNIFLFVILILLSLSILFN